MNDIVQWTAPSPLWAAAAGDATDPARETFRRPAILRFASDTFMEEFMSVLEADPSKVADYLAQPETWRGPANTPEPPQQLRGFDLRLERLRLAARRKALGTALPVPAGSAALAEAKEKLKGGRLKLYQPAHQRYYLVTACFVCRIAGLPDHVIDRGREEAVSFVIRRLIEKKDAKPGAKEYDEYAFVTTPQGHAWRKAAATNGDAAAPPVEGEEQLPLFTVSYDESDGRRRRLLAGMIPTGRREAYAGAPLTTNGNGAGSSSGAVGSTQSAAQKKVAEVKTARKILFRSKVTEPWKSLISQADYARRKAAEGTQKASTGSDADKTAAAAEAKELLTATREQIQTVSWYVLLDFADYLKQYMPKVYNSIRAKANVEGLSDGETKLLAALEGTTVSDAQPTAALVTSPYKATDLAPNLRDALHRIIAFDGEKPEAQRSLERVTGSYDRANPSALWPKFLFPLADPGAGVTAARIPASVPAFEDEQTVPVQPPLDDVERALQNVDKLVGLVFRALRDDPQGAPVPTPPAPLASSRPFIAEDGLFQIRCVFARPMCGPLEPPVVSEPTEVFQLAGFFDPDAPARPIRIALPIDTSPAGLRKFDKNTAFMISDVLCGQIARAKGLSLADLVLSILPWPFHKSLSVPDGGSCSKGGLEFGMICSLSIPIITICALILLMIIVTLFDLIFKWLPFFIMCFPLPGFKAKK